MNDLIFEDSIFISDALSKEELFIEVSNKLLNLDLVTKNFLVNIQERELQYPTGLDLTPVHQQLPNIAVPHTEDSFVKTTRIVPVKLINPLEFNNMINPEQTLQVSFTFFILNNDNKQQAGILAKIMDFINSKNYNYLVDLFECTNEKKIYNMLKNDKETI